MNKISNFLSKISKKTKITILVITLIVLGITVLYQTFAISSNISGGSDNYTVTLNNNSIVTVPASGKKTVYFKIRNNNKGYKGTNITVKVYADSESSSTGTITESESKFIKLYLENTSTSDSSVELISILGYVNGGNLIIPDGYTLVTEKYEPPVIYNPPINLATYITNLYTSASKTTTTLDITYNLASSVGLMNDRFGSMSTGIDDGNIRCYGASPNNYIYFNCSDYNNQSSDTCETWRIIGVFDGNVKIMRGSQIGTYSWDTSDSSTNSGYGVNEWSQADLMKLLNSGYDSESIGGSLYWNAKSGTCYNGQNNATGSCNFTSTGLKNDTTRNLIAETTYYTRGHNTSSIYVDAMYDKERVSGTVITGVTPTRTLTWTGKIAIPYPSDYGYAADLSLCQKQLGSYNDATCTANNWMKNILGTNSWGWLLTPNSGDAYYAWNVTSSGRVGGNYYSAYDAYGVVPVLSLTSELDIGSGSGTSSSPYQLSV